MSNSLLQSARKRLIGGVLLAICGCQRAEPVRHSFSEEEIVDGVPVVTIVEMDDTGRLISSTQVVREEGHGEAFTMGSESMIRHGKLSIWDSSGKLTSCENYRMGKRIGGSNCAK